ncbi:unnamed protein product [Prunus armeniaca]
MLGSVKNLEDLQHEQMDNDLADLEDEMAHGALVTWLNIKSYSIYSVWLCFGLSCGYKSMIFDSVIILIENNIAVFCPGLTDGSLGDMFYFHSFCSLGLIVDLVQDIRAMNGEAVHANPRKTGMIILGGGLPKHHICNANMMRNGADYAVFINTAPKFDGSDSGAHPDEAVSWGKIRGSAKTEVHCNATIAFPLLVAETFAKKAVETMT